MNKFFTAITATIKDFVEDIKDSADAHLVPGSMIFGVVAMILVAVGQLSGVLAPLGLGGFDLIEDETVEQAPAAEYTSYTEEASEIPVLVEQGEKILIQGRTPVFFEREAARITESGCEECRLEAEFFAEADEIVSFEADHIGVNINEGTNLITEAGEIILF